MLLDVIEFDVVRCLLANNDLREEPPVQIGTTMVSCMFFRWILAKGTAHVRGVIEGSQTHHIPHIPLSICC